MERVLHEESEWPVVGQAGRRAAACQQAKGKGGSQPGGNEAILNQTEKQRTDRQTRAALSRHTEQKQQKPHCCHRVCCLSHREGGDDGGGR